MIFLEIAVGSFVGTFVYNMLKAGVLSKNPTISWGSSIAIGAIVSVFAYAVLGLVM